MTTGRMAAAVHVRFRQPSFAGAAVAARMRSTRVAHRACPSHFQTERSSANLLHEIEQYLRVGRLVFNNLERLGVADDFGQFSQPAQLPPRERAEPEHGAIERGQQEDIEVTVGDVGPLMGEHGLTLLRYPNRSIAAGAGWSIRT